MLLCFVSCVVSCNCCWWLGVNENEFHLKNYTTFVSSAVSCYIHLSQLSFEINNVNFVFKYGNNIRILLSWVFVEHYMMMMTMMIMVVF